jgi:hypothetical protein
VFRTEHLKDQLALPGLRRAGPDRLVDAKGNVTWMLHAPARRIWSATGCLADTRPVAYSVEEDDDGVRVVVDETSEVDLMQLTRVEAEAIDGDGPEALTVIGSFEPLGGAVDLARFFVGSTVLDTTDFGGRRCPSEQTALSIYRIARHRGGPFWNDVAEAVAEIVAARVRAAPDGRPVHDLLGKGESHTRFVADAVLLLLAAGDGDPATAAMRGLDGLAVPTDGGCWYLHDTLEHDAGRNDLVLNTHVHALVASRAVGHDVAPAMAALDSALSLRGEPRGVVLAAMLGISDRLRSRGRGHALAHRAEQMAARSRTRTPHLRLPGGWVARDTALGPAPSYFTVNLADLAVLERVGPSLRSTAALRAGLRFARASGHFAAQRVDRDPLAVLVPTLLRNAGRGDAARRAADATLAAGWAPAIGWPGYEDHLWAALPPGTP